MLFAAAASLNISGMHADLSDQTFLVTGGSSGLGLETVRALAAQGAAVGLVSRASGAGAELTETLKRETGNPRLYYFPADLASRDDVRRVAAEITHRFPRLDVLVNNAGGFFLSRRTSPDGLEMTFALNHLAPFLLTQLLLDALLRSPAPRVVNVASKAETFGRLHFDDLLLTQNYGSWKAYGQSKLANLLFSYQLARLLADTPVAVNALHPGTVATNIGGRVGRVLMKLSGPLFKTPAQGAQTILYLATAPQVAGLSGRYFIDSQPATSSPRSHDRAAQAELWRRSRDLVALTQSEAATLTRVAAPNERAIL